MLINHDNQQYILPLQACPVLASLFILHLVKLHSKNSIVLAGERLARGGALVAVPVGVRIGAIDIAA